MGYYIGREKFTWGSKRRFIYLLCALLLPTFLHFSYNYSLSNIVNRLLSSNMLIPVILAFFSLFYMISIIYIEKTIFLNKKFINNEKYDKLMTRNEANETYILK